MQPLAQAAAAGTVYAQIDRLEIQATTGLGMAIAWGDVKPDTYEIDPVSGNILNQQLGYKSVSYSLGTIESNGTERSQISPPVEDWNETDIRWAARNVSSMSPIPAKPQRVQSPKILASHPSSVLQAYLVPEEQQKRYVLTDHQIKQLVQLAQRLVADLGTPLELEWALNETESTQSSFYITQVISPLSVSPQQPRSLQSDQQDTPPSFTHDERGGAIPGARLLLSGLAVAKGRAIARARVIASLDEARETILPGTVLIAETIPPHWLRLIRQAAAIVTEQGSVTSHAAIIARESGVPAVMGVANVTQQVRTGDLVIVDGNQGKVYLANQSSRIRPY